MSGHTPGPWEFRVYADGCSIVSAHDRPGSTVRDHLKGVTISADAQIRDDQSNAGEASPDARLAVAAPELLAALVEAKKEMWLVARVQWTMADFKNWAVIQQIDAALTKATGVAR